MYETKLGNHNNQLGKLKTSEKMENLYLTRDKKGSNCLVNTTSLNEIDLSALEWSYVFLVNKKILPRKLYIKMKQIKKMKFKAFVFNRFDKTRYK